MQGHTRVSERPWVQILPCIVQQWRDNTRTHKMLEKNLRLILDLRDKNAQTRIATYLSIIVIAVRYTSQVPFCCEWTPFSDVMVPDTEKLCQAPESYLVCVWQHRSSELSGL